MNKEKMLIGTPPLQCFYQALQKKGRPDGRPCNFNYFFLYCCFIRSSFERIFFLRRRLLGVTSRISSSLRNSMLCSRLRVEWGTSLSASSEPDARVFVICFFLHTLQTMSSFFAHSPQIMPSYTGTPGPMKSLPLS